MKRLLGRNHWRRTPCDKCTNERTNVQLQMKGQLAACALRKTFQIYPRRGSGKL